MSLTDEKIKEMEEEMNRFEKEIAGHGPPAPTFHPVAAPGGRLPPPPPPANKSYNNGSFSNQNFSGSGSSQNISFLPPQLRSRLPPPPPPPQASVNSAPRFSGLSLPPPPPPAPVSTTAAPVSVSNSGSMLSPPGINSGSVVLPTPTVISAQPKLVYAASAKIMTKNGTSTTASKSDTFEKDLMELLGKSSEDLDFAQKNAKSNDATGSRSIVPSSIDNDEMEIDPEATSKPTVMSVAPPKPKSTYKRETAAQVSLQGRATNKKKKFIRTAAGQIWEDPTLTEWDPNDFRIFCGDLGNEVSDDVLTRAFSRYPSFQKAKIVRDKRTGKTRGFGFVSFSDATDFTKAMREMNGKYVGNRPIKLKRSDWRNRQIEVVKKRDKEKRKLGFKV